MTLSISWYALFVAYCVFTTYIFCLAILQSDKADPRHLPKQQQVASRLESRLTAKILETLTHTLDFQVGGEFNTTAKVQKMRGTLKQVSAMSKMFGVLGSTKPTQQDALSLRSAMDECLAIWDHDIPEGSR